MWKIPNQKRAVNELSPLFHPPVDFRRVEQPGEKSLLWSFICSIIFLVTALTVLCPVLLFVQYPTQKGERGSM